MRQAFLQTSRGSAEVDLLRYYDDQAARSARPARPFLEKERAYTINTNAGGTDSRGIAIDPSPRLACEAHADRPPAARRQCAEQLPARVFIANRTPPSIVVGADRPHVEQRRRDLRPRRAHLHEQRLADGGALEGLPRAHRDDCPDGKPHYVLRLFVVCFDSSTVFVFDPNELGNPAATPEALIYTGAGPFALAFDPFSLEDVATERRRSGRQRARRPASLSSGYRFAYVASFTQSYLQVIDLDDDASRQTSGAVVFTLGKPTTAEGPMTMSRLRLLLVRSRLMATSAAAAAVIASCSQTPTNVPVRTFELRAEGRRGVHAGRTTRAASRSPRPIP